MINYLEKETCPCGKKHCVDIDEIVIGSGVVTKIAEYVKKYDAKKPFVFGDANTFGAVGNDVVTILKRSGIESSVYVFQDAALEPDEKAVGSLFMHFDSSCDIVVGVGSGVINDLGKILSRRTNLKYIIVATAPSMDGYASASSSMNMDGLKVSLPTKTADVIIGDINVLKNAPIRMLKSGIGDMLAKYVSIAEWRIANVVTGEYYCEEIAKLIRVAVKKCVDNAENLLKRQDDAVKAVFEGLIIGGVAMAYAGVSRPASGVEHYFSHIWDMRGLEFGTKVDLHGIQCALGTLFACKLYEKIKTILPNEEKGIDYADNFNLAEWNKTLRTFLGKASETMIDLELKEKKYDKSSSKSRLKRIIEKWGVIKEITDQEIPPYGKMSELLDILEIEKDAGYLDIDGETLKTTFKATKDIRDKYVLSRLAFDLGILDELSSFLVATN